MSQPTTEYLSQILSPSDTDSFLKHYQTREHLHVARALPGYYADVLSVEGLDAFLQSEHLPAAFVNVVKDGTTYGLEQWSRFATSARGDQRVAIPEKLFELYGEGATLILNQADRVVPSLNAACRALTLEMGLPVQANIYITPRAAAGFSRHSDDHEVLILQIAGSKRWLLYPQMYPQMHPQSAQPAPGANGTVEIDLQCGDLLYLPRGLAHSARAQEADSIHVTIGLRLAYAFELIEELAALAGENGDFLQPMPPRFADEASKHAYETAFLCQLQSLISKTSLSELMERRFHALVEKQAKGWPGRLSDLRLLHDVTQATVVCRRPGILTRVRNDGKFLSVDFAGKCVTIPVVLEGPLDTIMSGNTFAIQQLEGLINASGKVKLVAEFVKAGLLRIVTI
jgi:hypothetical protein